MVAGGLVVGGTAVVAGPVGTVTTGYRSSQASSARTARPPPTRAQATSALRAVSLATRRRARRYTRAGSGGLTARSP